MKKYPQGMRENRRHIRLHAPIGLIYKRTLKGKRPKPQLTLVRNLSGGGLSFTAKETLRQGELLELEIQVPHLTETIQAMGEVVWFTPNHPLGPEAGIRFRDIEPEDLKHVLEYVHAIGIG